MTHYILRLDDACEWRDISKWDAIERLCDSYGVKPIVAVIPHCEDSDFLSYHKDKDFWSRANAWVNKGWTIAMHGYSHVLHSSSGGINPVNQYSEFVGLSLEEQRIRIKKGFDIMRIRGLKPEVFVAPAHTFDENTLFALREETTIRFISDTPTYATYSKEGFTFVPQQAGRVRVLPFRSTTFCYHPNTMKGEDFKQLEGFIKNHEFVSFPLIRSKRKLNWMDVTLMKLYYAKHA